MTKLSPNPPSPYATANPEFRHLIPSFLGVSAVPGMLAFTTCDRMAVVPDSEPGDATDILIAGQLADLPEGLCPDCIAVATGQAVTGTTRMTGECSECRGGPQGVLCSLCRQSLHSEWQRQTRIHAQIRAERDLQDAKFGEQNHRDGTGLPIYRHAANRYRDQAKRNAEDGALAWRDVLLEEVYEALAEKEPEALRAELVQVAAVATAWVEAIDRRSEL
ncbi:hypothetical protein EDD29_0115 [Actinocorallia herbida]|uniref:Uncharacterized protein n=1 Tax=Actinocorallia herbida TaxID=58109 RepID=A0A3N1CNA6_9ACTN|nr:hypothetical protein [Actinocorallia herbida]ROO82634.1 hypothetical protein EDD29_0115 [Actinocorallia herbida]